MLVGVFLPPDDTDQQYEAMGLGGLSVGNTRAKWEALFAELNERGGLLGHRVRPVYHTLQDLTGSNAPAEYEAACRKWTEDQPVFLVWLSITGTETFFQCMARAAVPVVSPWTLGLDADVMARFPRLFSVTDIERSTGNGRTYPAALADMGFFEDATVGLLRTDAPVYDRVVDQHLMPTLKELGVEIAREFAVADFTQSGAGGLASQMSSAVLRFRTAGVTHVIFVTNNGGELVFFMQNAESQGYRPRYGLASYHTPAPLAELVPAAQLRGAVGLGWLPDTDVNAAQDPGGRPAVAPCLEVMERRASLPASRAEQAVAVTVCDAVFFVEHAIQRLDALTVDGFVHQAERLGTSFEAAGTFGTAFAPERRTGATAYRQLRFDDTCGCFSYTSDVHQFGQ